jgi:hypothetical protein
VERICTLESIARWGTLDSEEKNQMLVLGQTKWIAKAAQHSKVSQPCPDCFGKKYLIVTLGDDSQVIIDCATCAAGYEPPKGYLLIDQYEPDAELITVQEMEMELIDGKHVVLYSGNGFYRVPEAELFDCKLDALERARVKAEELAAEVQARFQRKEKDTRTWAWNVTYHRRCIKQAQRDLEYHTKKLAVSLPHKKDKE